MKILGAKIKYNKLLWLFFLVLVQSSCGFRPAYKKYDTTLKQFAGIEVAPIDTVEGAHFYEHLKTLFPAEKEPQYILNTSLAFSRSYNIIMPNSDILRETQNIAVSYQLLDKKSLKTLTYGNFKKMSSYSINFSLYSNSILRQESAIILTENAAEEVRNRLLTFFASKDEAKIMLEVPGQNLLEGKARKSDLDT